MRCAPSTLEARQPNAKPCQIQSMAKCTIAKHVNFTRQISCYLEDLDTPPSVTGDESVPSQPGFLSSRYHTTFSLFLFKDDLIYICNTDYWLTTLGMGKALLKEPHARTRATTVIKWLAVLTLCAERIRRGPRHHQLVLLSSSAVSLWITRRLLFTLMALKFQCVAPAAVTMANHSVRSTSLQLPKFLPSRDTIERQGASTVGLCLPAAVLNEVRHANYTHISHLNLRIR